MKTFKPTKQFNLKIRLPEDRKNDHEDRVWIANASSYMPPIPSYNDIKVMIENNRSKTKRKILSILIP